LYRSALHRLITDAGFLFFDALPSVLCSSEIWNISGRDARRITAAEEKHTRKIAECIWIDYRTNTEIVKVLTP
jgi:hypothetical protein